MPHVSRNKLDKKVERQLVANLELILTKLSTPTDTSEFLSTLLTPTEKIMLAKRIGMVILLGENIPESRIASTLHLTRVTVAKMQFYVEARGKGFVKAMSIVKGEKIFIDLRSALIKLASYTIKASFGRL